MTYIGPDAAGLMPDSSVIQFSAMHTGSHSQLPSLLGHSGTDSRNKALREQWV